MHRSGRNYIGDAVAKFIDDNPNKVVIAVVPRMLSNFANMPERYEVSEVDIIVRETI